MHRHCPEWWRRRQLEELAQVAAILPPDTLAAVLALATSLAGASAACSVPFSPVEHAPLRPPGMETKSA